LRCFLATNDHASSSSLSDWGFGGGDFSGLKRVAG
jgi:hypothetical protein